MRYISTYTYRNNTCITKISEIKHVARHYKKEILTLLAYCNAAPLRIRIPCLAATPVATSTAVGVASPKAQGHALTHTACAFHSMKNK